MAPYQPPPVLTIGGSDSGGAAGVQADLKTFTAFRVYGMSALTVVTAQNSVAVTALHHLPPDFVATQIEAIFADYGAAAVKTGFIGLPGVVETIAARLRSWHHRHPARPLVVDPVLVDHRGTPLFPGAVTEAYRRHLLPGATLITPNRAEAALLAGIPVEDERAALAAAHVLHAAGAEHVLVTGLPRGPEMVDLFFDGREGHFLTAPRLLTANTHGSGDTLSAAITAAMARGLSLPEAIARARAFTHQAIAAAAGWRLGAGHGPLQHWPPGEDEERGVTIA